ncbi:MAG: LytTR family DNA-binding domain-containing protein [Fibrobacterales bacterium]
MYTVIIIDDEQGARDRIKSLLSQKTECTIIGEASFVDEATDLINTLQPDLIFLDIEIHDKTAFDLIKKLTHNPIIIFTTAYNKYALEAFTTTKIAIEYLLKPIKEDDIDRVLNKIHRMKVSLSDHNALVQLLESKIPKQYIKWIHCNIAGTIQMVNVASIRYIKSDERYSVIYTDSDKEYPVNTTLNELETQLDPDVFTRIHRSTIVNRHCIESIKKSLYSCMEVEVKGDSTLLDVSRSYSHQFK